MTSFDRAPFVAIWEITRACALACVHCRAEARPGRDSDELTTDEGRRLIDEIAGFGDPPPLLVLTGGDPLRRPDVADLVRHGAQRGLSVSLTPSGTAAATEARLRELRDAGLSRLAVSLDGASATSHDAFRRVAGSHRRTMRIIERARALGLPLQINTTVCRQTVGELDELARQLQELDVTLWALFFLIPVGRAQTTQALAAREIERVLEWAADLAARAPFGVKTTEAPHFHRILAARAARGGHGAHGSETSRRRADMVGRAGRAVTDGNGFVFVDHVGNVCPSGFLPLVAGNVRSDNLVAVYREAPIFRELREPTRLRGRCGACEHRDRCGGSRARAHAFTGDAFAEDPGCAWIPSGTVHPSRAIAGGSDVAPATVRPADVTEALRTVLDPELGMSVVDLGLIYDIAIEGSDVTITMTLTAPGCPIHDVMGEWVRAAVREVPGVERVDVVLTFDPPWTPDRIGRS